MTGTSKKKRKTQNHNQTRYGPKRADYYYSTI